MEQTAPDWVVERMRLADAIDKAEEALVAAELAYKKFKEKRCLDELESLGLLDQGFGGRTREQWMAECDKVMKKYSYGALRIYYRKSKFECDKLADQAKPDTGRNRVKKKNT